VEPIEKLTIDTPEQISLEYPLAGLGSRFLALLLDSLIQGVVVFFVFLAMVILMPGIDALTPEGAKWLIAVWIIVGFLLYWGYFALFETVWKGQTPGKRALGLRVIKDNGGSIGASEAMSRNLLRAIDSLGGYAVGILTIFLNKQNKRLGDYVAGTVVVHEHAANEAQPYWNTRESGTDALYTIQDMRPEEVEVLESFLARRIELDPQTRWRIGHEMASRMATRLQLSPEQRPQDEDLIEAVVRQYRKSASYR
jgi:uncharacterized RDD family membrane protein YckC